MRKILTALLVGLIVAAPSAHAAIVTVQISGTLTVVDASLASAVSIGDPFSATLTYDSNQAPSPLFASSTSAYYVFPIGAYSMSATVGGYMGSSSAGAIEILNNGFSDSQDWFQATAQTTTGFSGDSIAGLIWRQATITLKDLEAGIFSDTSIPSSMSAAAFDIALLDMYFGDTAGNFAGRISSNNGTLAISSVPLPAAAWLLLSGLGGLGLLRRRKAA